MLVQTRSASAAIRVRVTNTKLRQELFAAIHGFPRLREEEKTEVLMVIEGLCRTLRNREHDMILSPSVRKSAGRYADQADIPISNFRLELDLPIA